MKTKKITTKNDKSLKNATKLRVKTLINSRLFADNTPEKIIHKTIYYVCKDASNDNIILGVSVVSTNLIVTVKSTFNNNESDKFPRKLGTNNKVKGNTATVYAVATSTQDDVTFTLNVILKGGYRDQTVPVSIPLNSGETGEIVVKINFV